MFPLVALAVLALANAMAEELQTVYTTGSVVETVCGSANASVPISLGACLSSQDRPSSYKFVSYDSAGPTFLGTLHTDLTRASLSPMA